MQRKLQKTRVLQRDINAVTPVYSTSLFMKYMYTRCARILEK